MLPKQIQKILPHPTTLNCTKNCQNPKSQSIIETIRNRIRFIVVMICYRYTWFHSIIGFSPVCRRIRDSITRMGPVVEKCRVVRWPRRFIAVRVYDRGLRSEIILAIVSACVLRSRVLPERWRILRSEKLRKVSRLSCENCLVCLLW